MIELRDVCFSAESAGVKKDILQNINLKIDERFVCLTGPNGSGKSTDRPQRQRQVHAGTDHRRYCKTDVRSDHL